MKLSTPRGPTTPTSCTRDKCLPCTSSYSTSKPNTTSSSSNCWARGPTYKITCLPCKASGQLTQYWGESGHTLYSRSKNHWEGLVARNKQNVLHLHAVAEHGGQHHQLGPKDFTMELEASHRSNLGRQIHEGTLLASQIALRDQETREGLNKPRKLLNSRTEFFQPGLIKPRPMKILY